MAHLLHTFSRAILNLRRSLTTTSLTVATVAVAFTLLGMFVFIAFNLERLAGQLQSGFRLVVYLQDEITQRKIDHVRTLLVESRAVDKVSYVSPEQAADRFRQRLGEANPLLTGLDSKSLPASFEATFRTQLLTEHVNSLTGSLAELPGVEQVSYGRQWLERYFDFQEVTRLVALLIAGLIVLATLLIVSNTIRLSLFSRQAEIRILKLVGATEFFIKAPFVLEGMLLSTLGALLGVWVAWFLGFLASLSLRIPLGPGTDFQLTSLPFGMALFIVLGGTLLGFLATLSSLWRHIH
jgi:cell division transport system permease protein